VTRALGSASRAALGGASRAPERPADAVFEAERPRLVGIAYRMTGSYADAEDAVQDAWLRWRAASAAGPPIDRPAAWLTTVVSRIALDWLPEPVRTDPSDPADLAVLAESLRLGFLVLLDRLAPVERIVLLMADVFAVPFAEIAAAVDKTPEACRQIASRARRHLHSGGAIPAPTSAASRSVVEQFVGSLVAGDLERMIELSADDLVLTSDGGADHRAARHPVLGPARVTRFLHNLASRWTEGVSFEVTTLNGDPAIVLVLGTAPDRRTIAVVFEADERVVRRVLMVVNPDKLLGLATTLR
jgi:RNA polymerase sigma-70 factor (ECF subfamily)